MTLINIDEFTFKVINDDIEVSVPKERRELWPIAETLNEIPAVDLWQGALDTLDGKRPFPYWTGGDSMEVQVEEDGTWFREQEEWRHNDGTKVSNKDAREIINRFVEAYKAIDTE
jgi:hypothetical protein